MSTAFDQDVSGLTADRDAIAEHLDRYLDVPGLLGIFALPSRESECFDTTSEGIEAAVEYVINRGVAGDTGIYRRGTTLATRLPPGKRGDADDSRSWTAYQLDLDFGKDGYAPDAETVRRVAGTADLPEPTEWHNSGHGLYAVWLLTRPVPDSPEVRALARAIEVEMARAFAAEGYKIDSTHDAARVWRVLGTVNGKDEPVLATTLSSDGPHYPWGDLQAAVPNAAPSQPRGDRTDPDERRYTMDQATSFVQLQAVDPVRVAANGTRNKMLNNAAYIVGHFVAGGFWPEDVVIQRLTDLGREIGLDDNEIGPTVRSGLTAGIADEPDAKGERFGRCVKVEPDPFAATSDDTAELAALVRKMRLSRQAKEMLDAESRPPRRLAATVSLAALLAEPDPEERYRIEGLLPTGGKVVLKAPQKAGKTTLNGNLVRCLADGDPFLPSTMVGGFPGFKVVPVNEGRRVVLLDFEMTRQQLKDWLRAQRIKNQDAVHVELLRGQPWDIRDDKIRAEWAAHLRAIDAEVLIIDPAGPVVHLLGIDENANPEIGRFLTNIDRLCDEAGISEKFVTHHMGKSGETARGASAWEGWPDAIWSLYRDGATRFFSADGRDVLQPEAELEYDRYSRRLGLGLAVDRATAKSSGNARIIGAIVKESPGKTGRELRALARDTEIGTTSQNATDAIKTAISTKQIHFHPGPNSAHLHYPGPRCDDCPQASDGAW